MTPMRVRPTTAPDTSPEALLTAYIQTGDVRLRNQVVEDHRWLAVVIARDYCTGSEPLDDLIQVACVAMLKAAERFDPRFGVEFKTFAAVTARGELRRYYRDATWSIRVPRRLQELRYEVRAATEVLRERLRRSPDTNELAEYLHVEPDEIIDCLCADSNFRALSIDHAEGGENLLGDDDRSIDSSFATVESMDAFRELAALLPERLRRIVEMRFVDEMKQSDIAAEMGVSQVQISRLLRTAMERLRPLLEHRDRQSVPRVVSRRRAASRAGERRREGGSLHRAGRTAHRAPPRRRGCAVNAHVDVAPARTEVAGGPHPHEHLAGRRREVQLETADAEPVHGGEHLVDEQPDVALIVHREAFERPARGRDGAGDAGVGRGARQTPRGPRTRSPDSSHVDHYPVPSSEHPDAGPVAVGPPAGRRRRRTRDERRR